MRYEVILKRFGERIAVIEGRASDAPLPKPSVGEVIELDRGGFEVLGVRHVWEGVAERYVEVLVKRVGAQE